MTNGMTNMDRYDPADIEPKWQRLWDEKGVFQAEDFSQRTKAYLLFEFPYPSGDGLHVGHCRPYSAMDAIARKRRMEGQNVLFPIGWDAFGLPTENYALKTGVHPRVATDKNIATFRRQMKALGLSLDWSREVDTTDPQYYRWTQWLFLKFFKQGLAYQATMPINWCPKDKIGLANEEVVAGKCERCGTEVTKKLQKQWMLKITAYAERLLKDLDTVDYPERIKTQQVNWIGKSEGAEIEFRIANDELRNGRGRRALGTGRRRFVLLHGFNGTAGGVFFPWLKKELEAAGHEVIAPNLPNPSNPTEAEQVHFVLKNVLFDEHTVLFGHSLGAVVALKVVEKLKKPIAGLVLAGGFTEAKFKDRPRPFQSTFSWQFDWQRIRQRVGFSRVLRADVETRVPAEATAQVAAGLGAPVIDVHVKRDHFTGQEEPTLLRALLQEQTVLLATNNRSKAERIRALGREADLPVQFVTPADLGLDVKEVREGSDLRANAEAKGRAYRDTTDLPILGQDGGLLIDREDLDPAKIKRNALGEVDERALSQEDIAKRMEQFYQSLARKHGGEVKAAFVDVFALVLPDGTVRFSESRRPITITAEARGPMDIYYPIRHIYRSDATGKFVQEQTAAETAQELAPYREALRELFAPVIRVFTTRPDTLFGTTYVVLAPEHPLVAAVTTSEQRKKVAAYLKKTAAKSDLERDLAKEKTGVFTGAYAINPANRERIPIWVADYVLLTYGTGAIMAVPAHDERDNEFAKKFRLEIREVVRPNGRSKKLEDRSKGRPAGVGSFVGDGVMMNSGEYDGMGNVEAGKKIVAELEKRGLGKPAVQYKLRDWVFSRQHYWGEPIPIIHCPEHGAVPVPEDQLPVELPYVEKYQPTGTGESPLATVKDWVNTTCPVCKKPAKRETDTMPNWAGSSWYFLRYTDPKNPTAFADPKNLKYWLPVDLYEGGMEHTTLHLLYSRFWHKFLYDQKLVPTPEPYAKRRSHGIVLAEDGRKMSKSFGNVINPDEVIEQYGADSLRLYELFMGPFEDAIPWSTRGLIGMRRFLERVWDMFSEPGARMVHELHGKEVTVRDLERTTHSTIKKVSDDLENFRFNTAVSSLMEFVNLLRQANYLRIEAAYDQAKRVLLLLLYPMAPHTSSELGRRFYAMDIDAQRWPEFDAMKGVVDAVQFVVQVAGKRRAALRLPKGSDEATVRSAALALPGVQRHLKGEPTRVVFVPDRIINFIP